MKKSAEAPIRQRRPFGIWALTVFALVIAGILPIYSVILLVFFDPGSSLEVASFLTIAFIFVISLGVVVTAVGAWLGRNSARKALLVFITLSYAPQIISSVAFVLFYKEPKASSEAAGQQILQGLVTVAIYIWYFNRARVKRFYGVGVSDEHLEN